MKMHCVNCDWLGEINYQGEPCPNCDGYNLVPVKNPAAVALGSLGGKSTSDAKRKASAENGKKGGRPRKTK